MSNSRRNFCKNTALLGLGFSFSPLVNHAKANQSISKKALILTKNAHKTVKVNGQIRYGDLSPANNAMIEIWHNNSEDNPSKFDYEGKLMTDSEGNFSFETDFPKKHFEEGYFKMRRICFKVKTQQGKEILTKLYFGENGIAHVDGFHINEVPQAFKFVLPTTKIKEDLITVQFDIYLNNNDLANYL